MKSSSKIYHTLIRIIVLAILILCLIFRDEIIVLLFGVNNPSDAVRIATKAVSKQYNYEIEKGIAIISVRYDGKSEKWIVSFGIENRLGGVTIVTVNKQGLVDSVLNLG